MPLQKSSAPWAPSENDASRLTAQLRASRLTVLCGDVAAPLTDLLKTGVMPHLQQRSEDRVAALGVLKRKVVRTPDRRQRPAGADTEVLVFFDQWQGEAREALMARIHAALKPRKAGKDNGQLPRRVGDRLKLLSDRCGVRFLLVFDGFEHCLLAPAENHDLRALREEIYTAINQGELAAQFLLTVREQGEPLLDRLRGRVRGFDATRLLMPIEGAEDRGMLTLSTVPLPQAASARTRTAQTGAVYASIEAMLEQMTRRSAPDEDGAPPYRADVPELPFEDATLLSAAEPAAPMPEVAPTAVEVRESLADATPEVMPEVMPEVTPEVMPEVTQAVTPEPTPEPTVRADAPEAPAEPAAFETAAAPAPEPELIAEPSVPVVAEDTRDHEAEAREKARAEAKLEMVIAMADEAIAAAVARQQPGAATSDAEIGPGAQAPSQETQESQETPEAKESIDATQTADPASADAAPPVTAPATPAPPSYRPDPTLATLFTEASLSSFMSELDDVIEQASPPSQRASGLSGVAAPDMQRWADEVSDYLDGPAAPSGAAINEAAAEPPMPPAAAADVGANSDGDDADDPASPPSQAKAEAPGAPEATVAPESPESPTEPPADTPWSFDTDAALGDVEPVPTPPHEHAAAPAAVRPAAVIAAQPSSMLVVRGPRSVVARDGAARGKRPPMPKRMSRTLVPLAAVALVVGLVVWGLRGPDGSPPWANDSAPLATLPIDSEPTAAGGAVNGVPPIELIAPGPMALRLADELALGFHPVSGPGLVARSTQGWAEDLSALRGAQRLAISRFDALQAARDDPAIGPLQIVMPLYAEELVFVVRDDSPLRYIHQIQGRHINTGDAGSARALTVRTAYERLFASKLPEANTSKADEPEALKELLDRSTDVVALVGSVPAHWMDPQGLQGAQALRLLILDRNHPASRRALRSLLPARLAVGVDGRPAAQPTPTLAMMSFLVASGGSWGGAPRARPAAQDDDEAALAIGTVTRTLCERLPALQRDGHPKWHEVRPAIPINAGWPYSPEARRILRDCTSRASGQAQQGTAADTGPVDAVKLAGIEDSRR